MYEVRKTRTMGNLNWGAFWLTWIWGIGNKTYIALLALLPILNVIMPFYLLFKGNELAYEAGDWIDETEFCEVQQKWSVVGWVLGILIIVFWSLRFYGLYEIQKVQEEVRNEVINTLELDDRFKHIVDEGYEIEIMFWSDMFDTIHFNYALSSHYQMYILRGQADKSGKVTNLEVEFVKNGEINGEGTILID